MEQLRLAQGFAPKWSGAGTVRAPPLGIEAAILFFLIAIAMHSNAARSHRRNEKDAAWRLFFVYFATLCSLTPQLAVVLRCTSAIARRHSRKRKHDPIDYNRWPAALAAAGR